MSFTLGIQAHDAQPKGRCTGVQVYSRRGLILVFPKRLDACVTRHLSLAGYQDRERLLESIKLATHNKMSALEPWNIADRERMFALARLDGLTWSGK